ncbi:TRAP transporter substrate-binding protein DctP [bacterium]|nr:TRAP transporter substrate-binding protein DctP [bacterium]
MNKWIFFLITLIIICIIVAPILKVASRTGKATGKEIIKLGTLAPKESDWGKMLQLMSAELIEESGEQLQFKLQFGRDEEDLTKPRRQFDVVSLTATGLGQVLRASFIFQLPMLFKTYDELDCVRSELTPEFSKMFDAEGYVLLGWGDLGFINLFSKKPIKTQADLKETRLWVWDIDQITQKFASESGKTPITLPIRSVRLALKNGDIQTVYTSPYGCIALGWHPEVKYMSDLRLAAGVGATIISKKRYDKLSDKHQDLLRKIAKKYHEPLVTTIREKNNESIGILERKYIEVIHVPHTEEEKWLQVAKQVQDHFAGQLYKKELLDKVRSLLAKYRKDER